jgi:hypothetical protein
MISWLRGPSGTGSAFSTIFGWPPCPVSISSGRVMMRAPSLLAVVQALLTRSRFRWGSISTERREASVTRTFFMG